jgi:hypothetical protein
MKKIAQIKPGEWFQSNHEIYVAGQVKVTRPVRSATSLSSGLTEDWEYDIYVTPISRDTREAALDFVEARLAEETPA